MAPKPLGKNAGSSDFPPIAENPSAERASAPQGQASSSAADRPRTPPAAAAQDGTAVVGKKKGRRRGGKRKKKRRESFALRDSAPAGQPAGELDPSLSASFYRLGNPHSSTSLESESLLDHRDQTHYPPARRGSVQQGLYPTRSNPVPGHSPRRTSVSNSFGPNIHPLSRTHTGKKTMESATESDDADDRTPLVTSNTRGESSYGTAAAIVNKILPGKQRSSSKTSSRSGLRRMFSRQSDTTDEYDINNPPSVPPSPRLAASYGYDDAMCMGGSHHSSSPVERRGVRPHSQDAVIEIDGPFKGIDPSNQNGPSFGTPGLHRRQTMLAEDDVCFPAEGMSAIGEDEEEAQMSEQVSTRRRRRRRQWPELSVLEEWYEQEKLELIGEVRARKVSEPLMVGGRLRPVKNVWQRDDSEAPYRWTYFNQEFSNTIHSQTISELLQEGQTFRDLFIPDPPELSDSSSDEDDDIFSQAGYPNGPTSPRQSMSTAVGYARSDVVQSRASTRTDEAKAQSSDEHLAANTPLQNRTPREKVKRYGQRPVFWLDVLCPTEAEMRVLQRAFGIHPLTAEDIMMQEAREKVELFRNYYFVNYRTFDQDMNSEDYMDPVNMYAVVFHDGVISFHFSQTPHPANVRRRIRQLSEWLILSSDWISYGLIDDITDAYGPIVHSIEEEVDQIDDDILQMHTTPVKSSSSGDSGKSIRSSKGVEYEKLSQSGDDSYSDSSADMLRRVGQCRKKVMSLYRLLGNKADVIKGFAKRCNEQWQVAPRSEIGLYLGDIQDHIVTMNANLSHYENLLSRAHSNYLAQINIKSTERQEETADVLGKLTVLGTIVLPMNIITGLWGANVRVPGQDIENLWWFFGITMGLVMFGMISFLVAKRVYKLV